MAFDLRSLCKSYWLGCEKQN